MQKLVMQRDWECNYIKDIDERRKWCKQRINEINLLLSTGVYVDDTNEGIHSFEPGKSAQSAEKSIQQPSSGEFESASTHPTMLEAIAFTLREKKNLKHFRDYDQKLAKFKAWLIANNLKDHRISHFSHRYIKQFKDQLEDDGLGIRTVNNYLNTIALIFNTYNEYGESEKIIDNPMVKVRKDRNPKGKNIAFVPDQQKQILEFIAGSRFSHYELLSKTMFYTLARTKELSYLQPWMIGAKQEDQIHFPAEICKNGIEKNVTITDELEALFTKYKVRELPKDWFVFAKGLKPGPVHYNEKFIGSRYRENVLEPLKYNTDYTLYSWKHTGICMYYLNGVEVGMLMLQAGWEDPHTFKSYLKSLGLFSNSEIKAKSPKLPY